MYRLSEILTKFNRVKSYIKLLKIYLLHKLLRVWTCLEEKEYFQDGWTDVWRSMVRTTIYFNLLHHNVIDFIKSNKCFWYSQ